MICENNVLPFPWALRVKMRKREIGFRWENVVRDGTRVSKEMDDKSVMKCLSKVFIYVRKTKAMLN